jgi:catechol 2,3-dioxygenase-like lactoylglutathione lyase family enzyme
VQLNHLNLCTDDVAGLAAFFTGHFGFTLVALRGKDAFAVLVGSDGFALNLMKPLKGGSPDYPDGFHVGFIVADASVVLSRHAALAAAGRAPGEVQTITRGGARTTTFYCRAPGGVLVEIMAEDRGSGAA